MQIKSTSYRDLEVWKKAVKLATVIYEITSLFPARENYGLSSQVQRSAVSIAANIAEGQARNSRK
jgi:four helix bundle protein